MADKEMEITMNFQNLCDLTVANKCLAYLEAGKVPVALLPDTITGAVDYKGTWNATTNSPDLPAATPDKGDYYVVSVAGSTSLGGITDWNVGDWAIYNGTAWEKVDNTQEIDDTPQDGVTTRSISSNWAYDHSLLTSNATSPAHVPTVPASPTTKWLRGDNTWQELPASINFMAVDGRLSGNRERKDLDDDLEAFILHNANDYITWRARIPFGFDTSKVLRVNFGASWEGNEASGANFKIETYKRSTTFAVTPTVEDIAVPSGNEDIKLALYKEYAGGTFAVGDEVKIKLYKPGSLTVEDLAIHHVSAEIRSA